MTVAQARGARMWRGPYGRWKPEQESDRVILEGAIRDIAAAFGWRAEDYPAHTPAERQEAMLRLRAELRQAGRR